jgi:hypothetical protein
MAKRKDVIDQNVVPSTSNVIRAEGEKFIYHSFSLMGIEGERDWSLLDALLRVSAKRDCYFNPSERFLQALQTGVGLYFRNFVSGDVLIVPRSNDLHVYQVNDLDKLLPYQICKPPMFVKLADKRMAKGMPSTHLMMSTTTFLRRL